VTTCFGFERAAIARSRVPTPRLVVLWDSCYFSDEVLRTSCDVYRSIRVSERTASKRKAGCCFERATTWPCPQGGGAPGRPGAGRGQGAHQGRTAAGFCGPTRSVEEGKPQPPIFPCCARPLARIRRRRAFIETLPKTRLPVRGVREGLHPKHRAAGSIGPCWWSCHSRTSPQARDTTTSAEGLTEEMITELARLSPERLGVIARNLRDAVQVDYERHRADRQRPWCVSWCWKAPCAG